MGTLREGYPLQKTKPLKKTIVSVGGFTFGSIILVLIGIPLILNLISKNIDSGKNIFSSFNLWLIIPILISLIILLIILKYIYEVVYIKYYFYDLVGKSLIIKKGVFSRSEITLPLNRIQDVYVDQDILDRIFGLYDVHVSSATTISGSLSHIDGLDKVGSEAIKKLILSGIHRTK
ncbi:PH domain-containing protein [Candidatus Woesearchaeota archaeon]|nr:PH domain-containing protein [Candidatus Woesearchaeota archaeon]